MNKIKLSVIIKSLNEEKNIDRCIKSVIKATKGIKSEIILADSKSSDKTIKIAKKYLIKIVQLKDQNERSCGIGPQLGFQYSRGDYVYILDGDMEIDTNFFKAAMKELEKDPFLAGVGGKIKEINQENLEFKRRAEKNNLKSRISTHLSMGGLYKRKAINEVNYFSNRNLHSFEEFELGLRLNLKGWKLKRINIAAINHYGYTDSSLTLAIHRLKTKYSYGYGELIKSAIGKPYFLKTIANARIQLGIIIVWILIAGLIINKQIMLVLALPILLIVLLIIKKSSINQAFYSAFVWNIETIGLILGLFRNQKDPAEKIQAKIIKW